MNKKDKLSTHKKKAWDNFSLYIRTRDSILTTGGLDYCVCVTCPRQYPRLGVGCIQAGHFISGRTNAVLFSEKGVHGQCYGCNTGKNGAHVQYFIWMEQTYGRDTVDQLILESNQTIKFKIWDYDRIKDLYIKKTEGLLKNPSKAVLDGALPF